MLRSTVAMTMSILIPYYAGHLALRSTDIRSYGDLLGVVRRRMAELELTYETANFVGGLQSGYLQKLIGPTPSKCFGPLSLACVLGALGIKLVAVEDPEALAKVRDRLVKRRMALPGSSSEMARAAPQSAADSSSAPTAVYQPS